MDTIDHKVAARLFTNGVIACAEVESSLPVEVALLQPTETRKTWETLFHAGCDPDVPEAGTSGIEAFDDEASAREAYGRLLRYDLNDAIAETYAVYAVDVDVPPLPKP